MKILLSFAVLALSGAAALYYLNFFQKGNEVNTVSGKSFYDLSITALDGKTKINLEPSKKFATDLTAEEISQYTKADEYWVLEDPNSQKLANQLKTPGNDLDAKTYSSIF